MRSDKFEKWKNHLPEAELAMYAKATFGNRVGLGRRPALVNIDTTRNFVDPAYSQSGDANPGMLSAVRDITQTFRKLGLPIYYSKRDDRAHATRRGMFNRQLSIAGSPQYIDPNGDVWPEDFAPRTQDVIVEKNKPSAFFGTMLADWLRYDEVDTVVLVGVNTSGCVRAAAADAFSHNFRVTVIGDACGDRCLTAHRANLFDIDMKLGDVRDLSDVTEELERCYALVAA